MKYSILKLTWKKPHIFLFFWYILSTLHLKYNFQITLNATPSQYYKNETMLSNIFNFKKLLFIPPKWALNSNCGRPLLGKNFLKGQMTEWHAIPTRGRQWKRIFLSALCFRGIPQLIDWKPLMRKGKALKSFPSINFV